MKTNIDTPSSKFMVLAATAMLSVGWQATPASADSKRALIAAVDEDNLYANIDVDILSQLHHVNEVEINFGNTVIQKTNRQNVKDFAQMVVNDHTDADKKVLDIAKSKNLTLRAFSPVTARERTQARQEAAVERALTNSTGARLNRVYLTAMRDDHSRNIRWLESVQDNLQYMETKDLVQNLLPGLRNHRDTAVRLLALPPE